MNKYEDVFMKLVEGYEGDELMLSEAKKWIQKAIKHKGALTATAKKAGAVHGDKIDKGWLKSKSKEGGKTGRRARLALTLGKLRKEGLEPEIVDRILLNLINECDYSNPSKKVHEGPKGMEHTNTKEIAKVPEREVGLKNSNESYAGDYKEFLVESMYPRQNL